MRPTPRLIYPMQTPSTLHPVFAPSNRVDFTQVLDEVLAYVLVQYPPTGCSVSRDAARQSKQDVNRRDNVVDASIDAAANRNPPTVHQSQLSPRFASTAERAGRHTIGPFHCSLAA